MSRRASSGPKVWTGALNQSGSRLRQSLRNATRRGQSGQSRGGSAAGASSRTARLGLVFVVELILGAGPLWRGRALQELRRMAVAFAARLARFPRRAFARIAPYLALQLDDVEE